MVVVHVHRRLLLVPTASCVSATCLAGKTEGYHLRGGKVGIGQVLKCLVIVPTTAAIELSIRMQA